MESSKKRNCIKLPALEKLARSRAPAKSRVPTTRRLQAATKNEMDAKHLSDKGAAIETRQAVKKPVAEKAPRKKVGRQKQETKLTSKKKGIVSTKRKVMKLSSMELETKPRKVGRPRKLYKQATTTCLGQEKSESSACKKRSQCINETALPFTADVNCESAATTTSPSPPQKKTRGNVRKCGKLSEKTVMPKKSCKLQRGTETPGKGKKRQKLATNEKNSLVTADTVVISDSSDETPTLSETSIPTQQTTDRFKSCKAHQSRGMRKRRCTSLKHAETAESAKKRCKIATYDKDCLATEDTSSDDNQAPSITSPSTQQQTRESLKSCRATLKRMKCEKGHTSRTYSGISERKRRMVTTYGRDLSREATEPKPSFDRSKREVPPVLTKRRSVQKDEASPLCVSLFNRFKMLPPDSEQIEMRDKEGRRVVGVLIPFIPQLPGDKGSFESSSASEEWIRFDKSKSVFVGAEEPAQKKRLVAKRHPSAQTGVVIKRKATMKSKKSKLSHRTSVEHGKKKRQEEKPFSGEFYTKRLRSYRKTTQEEEIGGTEDWSLRVDTVGLLCDSPDDWPDVPTAVSTSSTEEDLGKCEYGSLSDLGFVTCSPASSRQSEETDSSVATVAPNTAGDNTGATVAPEMIGTNSVATMAPETTGDNFVAAVASEMIRDNSVATVAPETTGDNSVATVAPEIIRDNSVASVAPETTGDNSVATVAPEIIRDNSVATVAPETTGDNSVATMAPETTGDNCVATVAPDTTEDNCVATVAPDTAGDNYVASVAPETTGDNSVATVAPEIIRDNSVATVAPETTGYNSVATVAPETTEDNSVATVAPEIIRDNSVATVTTGDNSVATMAPETTGDNTEATVAPKMIEDNSVATVAPDTTEDNSVTKVAPNTAGDNSVATVAPGTTRAYSVATVALKTTEDNSVATVAPKMIEDNSVATVAPLTKEGNAMSTVQPNTEEDNAMSSVPPKATEDNTMPKVTPKTLKESFVATVTPKPKGNSPMSTTVLRTKDQTPTCSKRPRSVRLLERILGRKVGHDELQEMARCQVRPKTRRDNSVSVATVAPNTAGGNSVATIEPNTAAVAPKTTGDSVAPETTRNNTVATVAPNTAGDNSVATVAPDTTGDNSVATVAPEATGDNSVATAAPDMTGDNSVATVAPDTTGDNTVATVAPNTAGDNSVATVAPERIEDNSVATVAPETTGDNIVATVAPDTTGGNSVATVAPDNAGDNIVATVAPDTTEDNSVATVAPKTAGDNSVAAVAPETTEDNSVATVAPNTTGDNSVATVVPNTTGDNSVATVAPNTAGDNSVATVVPKTKTDDTVSPVPLKTKVETATCSKSRCSVKLLERLLGREVAQEELQESFEMLSFQNSQRQLRIRRKNSSRPAAVTSEPSSNSSLKVQTPQRSEASSTVDFITADARRSLRVNPSRTSLFQSGSSTSNAVAAAAAAGKDGDVSKSSACRDKPSTSKKTSDAVNNRSKQERKSFNQQDSDAKEVRDTPIASTFVEDNQEPRAEGEGRLVWAKLGSGRWWPGLIIRGRHCGQQPARQGATWVFWFGDHKVSQVPKEKVAPFNRNFKMKCGTLTGKTYPKAVAEAVQEAASRAKLSSAITWTCEEILQWAMKGFIYQGRAVDDLFAPAPEEPIPEFVQDNLLKIRQQRKQQAKDDDSDGEGRNQDPKEVRSLQKVKAGQLSIEEICLGCYTTEEHLVPHPFFKGGLCPDCKEGLMEDMFAIGDDGLGLSCAVCARGGNLLACDHTTCNRLYCTNCISDFVGPDAVDAIAKSNPWHCFLCSATPAETPPTPTETLPTEVSITSNEPPSTQQDAPTGQSEGVMTSVSEALGTGCADNEWQDDIACKVPPPKTQALPPINLSHGHLVVKPDWKHNILQLFNVTPLHPVAPEKRKPLRVLSLFDGIGTGRLVLDELGLAVEVYYASEIDPDALKVTQVRQAGKVTPIGDVRELTIDKVAKLGRIDLLIGGPPCNELSLCNPARKGLLGGTGLLFFDYCRVKHFLQILHPDTHLFWMMENVASMPTGVKDTISRFLECQPAVWNARDFSAQIRSRNFWGNIPGLYCHPQPESSLFCAKALDKVLMPGRTAMIDQVRTVTTMSNSLMQGKDVDTFPVRMGESSDTLWIPELEKMFGFPDHYTDVGNLPGTRRQKLLGKAWSIPVVKHILTPLREFFSLREENQRTSSETSS